MCRIGTGGGAVTRDVDLAMDAVDLRALHAVADLAEIALAREAVVLISRRGYDRGRDLIAALAALPG